MTDPIDATLPDTLNALLTRRNAAFEADDLNWAQDLLPHVDDPEVLAWAFHRARAMCVAVSMPKRMASNEWLKARQYKEVVL